MNGPNVHEGRFGQKMGPRFTAAVSSEAPPASDQDVSADERIAQCPVGFKSLAGGAVDSEETA